MTEESAIEAARAAGQHVRKAILKQSKRAGVGHIGSALSVADLVAAIYAVSTGRSSDDPDRDRVVLSKGHAALALYAVLNHSGVLSDDQLDTYCGEETLLGVHPEHALPGVDFSTGSLGQGLPMAVGAALAARMQGSRRRVFCVISDAECNEGSIWEAAMFAGHYRLDNLVLLVDDNGQQALGYTADISTVQNMEGRWRSFGWDASTVAGHNHRELVEVLQRPGECKPRVLVAKTTFGYGVSFMEREVKWHYLPMDDDQYQDALTQVEALA